MYGNFEGIFYFFNIVLWITPLSVSIFTKYMPKFNFSSETFEVGFSI